ncbi:MAG TPA: cell division protein ZipA C-terminal FtsZ-binding domain-containing protein [Burkholderiales bacterium]|nr:cell division protein ZipA C-terminal FtsZ-binding domain-containing protein [Burkholderiales bacterium]
MSELQLSLLVIGAVVIGVVYLYNWLQERSLRRRMQEAFGAARDDVLLKGGVESVLADGRLEPQLVPAGPGLDDYRRREAASPGRDIDSADGMDPVLDYAAEIDADAPIPDSVIGELTGRMASCGKPVRIAGLDPRGGMWEDVVRGRGGRFSRLRLSLQLVNRSGAINAAQLAMFCDAVRGSAARIPARAACPDTEMALQNARGLDAFCGEVDVAIGINVIAAEDAAFSGNRIRAAAEGAGFKLEPDGVFHYHNDRRETLFTLDNHEPAPFLPESIQGISTRGLTLLLDVPRVGDGAEVLDLMLDVARHLAGELAGKLVDDNRAALSETGIARIKEQVRSIHAAMERHGIPAGSPKALRLFS